MPTISETMGWRWATVRVIEIRSYGSPTVMAACAPRPVGFFKIWRLGNQRGLSGSATDMVSLDGPPRPGTLENAVDVVTYFRGVSGGPAIFPLERRKRWW
jgi:hypothetical protein